MSKTRWTQTSRDGAELMATEAGRPVAFVSDAALGYARPLAEGETLADAAADFGRAGEPAESAELLEAE